MSEDQITDSVTQFFNFKDEHHGPKSITIKILEHGYYNDIMNKYQDQKDLHVPNIKECDILHQYMGNRFPENLFMTSEKKDDNTITIADLKRKIYYGSPITNKQKILLTIINY